MSAVLTNPPSPPRQESPGLWTLAWRRLREDTVGMVSLVVVTIFIAMMIASYTGLIAKDWNKERGVSYANPSFMAGAENLEAKAMAAKEAAKAPPVDLSDIDPLAPRYKEWEERAAKIAVTEVKRSETLPFGGDKWGRDVLQKAVKGAEVSIFVGLVASLLAVTIGTIFGAVAGYFGKWANDFLEWFYNIFTSIPYILLILSFAAVAAATGKFGKGIVPHETMSTGTPKPRNERITSALMNDTVCCESCTRATWLTFGRMWWNMRERCEAPIACAAFTYSRLECLMYSARMRR